MVNEHNLLPMIGKLSKEFRAVIMDTFQKNGIQLSKEQAIVLKILSKSNDCPQHDLALVTARDKTSLTRLLSNMEKKDFISRRQCKNDRRVNIVSITAKGKSEFQKAEPILSSLFDKATAGIENSRIAEVKSLIKDIYTNLNIPYEK